MREPLELVFKSDEVTDETARLVVVAAVVVACWPVKFWRVVEPLNKALVKVAKSEVREPMMPVLARRLVVEARPETWRSVEVALVATRLLAVREPRLAVLERRSVVEARLEMKRLVVVASEDKSLATVPEAAVKFWSVVELEPKY
jgi:hypothetical protein